MVRVLIRMFIICLTQSENNGIALAPAASTFRKSATAASFITLFILPLAASWAPVLLKILTGMRASSAAAAGIKVFKLINGTVGMAAAAFKKGSLVAAAPGRATAALV